MCGIAGMFRTEPGAHACPEILERMTAVLRHRGPDEASHHVDGPVGLGHRRLSIIDVAGGSQPIFSDDRTRAIIFNGEIYNFRILRRALERSGHVFRTQSDTEVILRAYEEYGEKCVDRLRGMFAFAIWDSGQRRLFLARDRIGIKPLYYAWDGRTFLFASEIKGILEYPNVDRRLDPAALDDYLTYQYVPSPKSIFAAIRKLRAGHVLTVSEGGISERPYWDLDFAPDRGLTLADHAERLGTLIRESVESHLVSEVPIGAFLSGGIDSTAVVAAMAEILDRPVTTASIGFRDAAYDELQYARLAARRYRTDAYEKVVDPDAARVLDPLVWHYDEPFADSSMIPTYYVSQVARERVTVCLSGDGGDENFAGYRRYRFDALENRIRRWIPAPIRRGLIGPLGGLYPKADWLPRPLRAKTLLTNLSVGPEDAYIRTMTLFSPELRNRLYTSAGRAAVSGYDSRSVLLEHFERTRGWDPLSRAQYVDVKTYLTDDILAKVDRASMAHSLEVRVPILDHEVMEFAATIPARHKLHGREGKYVFKRALRGRVPDEILDRPKMGFSVPLARWFRRELKGYFEERALSSGSFVGELFDPTTIRTLWSRHQSGRSDYAHHLWALLVLECWGRTVLRHGR
jgi:asparagine synthase (glutamine-hydrolysing)